MNVLAASTDPYRFLLDTYETETLKTITIWSAFPDGAMDFRPAPKSRTVLEQMDHQIQSEGGWMLKMLGIDIGDYNPSEKTKRGYIERYRGDAARRLEILRQKPEGWWRETAAFFDVTRSRPWIFTRGSTTRRTIGASSSFTCAFWERARLPFTDRPRTRTAK